MTVTKKDTHGPLAAFLRQWRRLRFNTYEPHEVQYEVPLRIIFGPERPRRLLLIANEHLVSRIVNELYWLPKHWVIVQRYGMPGQEHADELASLSRRLRLPINFVGDLTPFGLHVFLGLNHLLGSRVSRPHWAGISARWLQLCSRLARRNGLRETVGRGYMSLIERDHFWAVREQAPWLEDALGAEPWLLMAKLETLRIEGASGVGIYGAGFHRKLVRLLDEETIGK